MHAADAYVTCLFHVCLACFSHVWTELGRAHNAAERVATFRAVPSDVRNLLPLFELGRQWIWCGFSRRRARTILSPPEDFDTIDKSVPIICFREYRWRDSISQARVGVAVKEGPLLPHGECRLRDKCMYERGLADRLHLFVRMCVPEIDVCVRHCTVLHEHRLLHGVAKSAHVFVCGTQFHDLIVIVHTIIYLSVRLLHVGDEYARPPPRCRVLTNDRPHVIGGKCI
jgi:hypothetical protein